nr:hypothetical protein Iba_chr08aCG13560 [Ipomoea batatas]
MSGGRSTRDKNANVKPLPIIKDNVKLSCFTARYRSRFSVEGFVIAPLTKATLFLQDKAMLMALAHGCSAYWLIELAAVETSRSAEQLALIFRCFASTCNGLTLAVAVFSLVALPPAIPEDPSDTSSST